MSSEGSASRERASHATNPPRHARKAASERESALKGLQSSGMAVTGTRRFKSFHYVSKRHGHGAPLNPSLPSSLLFKTLSPPLPSPLLRLPSRHFLCSAAVPRPPLPLLYTGMVEQQASLPTPVNTQLVVSSPKSSEIAVLPKTQDEPRPSNLTSWPAPSLALPRPMPTTPNARREDPELSHRPKEMPASTYTYGSPTRIETSRSRKIDWRALQAMLPTGRSPASAERRDRLWHQVGLSVHSVSMRLRDLNCDSESNLDPFLNPHSYLYAYHIPFPNENHHLFPLLTTIPFLHSNL